MKPNKFLLLFILTAIILTAVASATVYEVNNVYDGNTGKTLTGVSVIGYTCQDKACNTAMRLWPATMSTGNDNTIILSYPTELQSEFGYAVYFFKPGYFPYKVRADWYGEGRTPKDYTIKLYKLTETASSQIENFDVSDTSVKTEETITITADVLSPRINTNNIQFIPAELKDNYYSDKVKVSLLVNGRVTETKNLNMFWSTEQEVEFEFTLENEGDYTIQIITEITDNKFLSTENEETEKITVKVTKDETPEPNGDDDEDEDNQNKTPSGYRNLNKGDTWEDEQYQNQFKSVVLTSDESENLVKISAWQKFINWIKYIFRSLFWFLDN